jgi:hypothetical protein
VALEAGRARARAQRQGLRASDRELDAYDLESPGSRLVGHVILPNWGLAGVRLRLGCLAAYPFTRSDAVELRGFEPLTPCMPLMLGEFTTPRRTSRAHTTTLVRGAVEGRVVRRREVTCSAVSGKSLARAPCVIVLGANAGPIGRSPRPPGDWHLWCTAVLRRVGSRVLRRVMRQRRVRQSWARSGDMTADVACGAAWLLQVQVEGAAL